MAAVGGCVAEATSSGGVKRKLMESLSCVWVGCTGDIPVGYVLRLAEHEVQIPRGQAAGDGAPLRCSLLVPVVIRERRRVALTQV